MNPLKEKQTVPDTMFKNRVNNDWEQLSSRDFFKGKKVVLFALPGAFTPTCSSTHLPGYEFLASSLYSEGIDKIACLSVNDGFVMEAWGKEQGVKEVTLLADGNGDFSKGMGLLVEKSDLGFGHRSWRYSMLVDNGVIEKMFIEPEKDGDPFEVSDAYTMLNHINPNAKIPQTISMFVKPDCPFCNEAKEILKRKKMTFEEIVISEKLSMRSLNNITGKDTVPQIYIGSKHINGLDGLKQHFKMT